MLIPISNTEKKKINSNINGRQEDAKEKLCFVDQGQTVISPGFTTFFRQSFHLVYFIDQVLGMLLAT